MAKQAKKRPMSQAHRDALSAAQKRRWAAHRKTVVVGGKKRNVAFRMPKGVHVLRHNGGGKDIVEGSAREICDAVKLWRDLKGRLCN